MAQQALLSPAQSVEECRDRLALLASQYAGRRANFRAADYDETLTRQDFIDPFFTALGWDVANTERRWGKDREVVPEAKATGQRNRPDYAFMSAGTVKFLLEAKRPGVDLTSPQHIYQAKSYAYSRSAPLSVLGNFEKLMAFHSALPPQIDEPHVGRLPDLDLTYDKYEANAELLWQVFGRLNVLQGSVEKYVLDVFAQRKRRPGEPQLSLFIIPGARPFDREFLDKLSNWRRRLAEALYASNHIDSMEALAEAVQRVLDRLVFIRVCEDRAIETRQILKETMTGWLEGKHPSLIVALNALYKRLEPQYNSHLFKRHFSEHLKLKDETVLQAIIEELYPPRSPYRFDAVQVDLLGTIYERFLGETIEVNERGRIDVVEKAEIRHSGGIVYTPRWVVHEIVNRALKPHLENKSPGQLAKVRVLDPACGSGSFLLGATEALFDAHLAWYRKKALDEEGRVRDDYMQDIFIDPSGDLRLTLKKRQQIILNSIYGVDKDPQAVEVAEMSLYLRILEGEAAESISRQRALLLFKSTLLPDLSGRIRCGNSLITPSDLPQEVLLDDDRARRTRAFDWGSKHTGFGHVIAEGGFDVVIGNPPYIRIQALVQTAPDEVDAIRRIYPAASGDSFDIYLGFVEKGLKLLSPMGRLGFIMPMRWMKANYGAALRKQLVMSTTLTDVYDFGPEQVFAGVTTYTGLHFFSRKGSTRIDYKRMRAGSDLGGPGEQIRGHAFPYKKLDGDPWYIGQSPTLWELFNRLLHSQHTLESASERISQGIKTGRDEIFVLHKPEKNGPLIIGYSKALDEVIEVEADACKWLIKSGQMQRYHLRQAERVLLFPYEGEEGQKPHLIPFSALADRWPRLAGYLSRHEVELRSRERRRFDEDDAWHQYSRYQNMDLPGCRKIVVADMLNYTRFAFDDTASVCFMGGAAGGYGIVVRKPYNPWAVTAILNSTLGEWMLRPPGLSDWFAGGWFSGEARFIRGVPMLPPQHKDMAGLATFGQHLHVAYARLGEAVTEAERHRWINIIEKEERGIDQLLFDAFQVTDAQRVAISEQVAWLRQECGADPLSEGS